MIGQFLMGRAAAKAEAFCVSSCSDSFEPISVPAWMLIIGLGKVLGWPMALSAPVATVVMFGYNYLNARLAILRRFSLFNPAK